MCVRPAGHDGTCCGTISAADPLVNFGAKDVGAVERIHCGECDGTNPGYGHDTRCTKGHKPGCLCGRCWDASARAREKLRREMDDPDSGPCVETTEPDKCCACGAKPALGPEDFGTGAVPMFECDGCTATICGPCGTDAYHLDEGMPFACPWCFRDVLDQAVKS